ncbi:hypothetical protein, partial [Paenibacillus ottowii]|uniref:hypothetical protein n=1 Tax=Paenibacillus ottowii TaxID=2315729 RepID=UPI001ABFBBCC
IVDLWVKGLAMNWSMLYGDAKPQRISLPAYPFAKERYWITDIKTKQASIESPKAVQPTDIFADQKTPETAADSSQMNGNKSDDPYSQAIPSYIQNIQNHISASVKMKKMPDISYLAAEYERIPSTMVDNQAYSEQDRATRGTNRMRRLTDEGNE